MKAIFYYSWEKNQWTCGYGWFKGYNVWGF